ncbi:MAG: hypothetical protein ABIC95_05670 [archaeon]
MKTQDYLTFRRQASRILYWMTLLVMTLCNLVVAIILIPILLAVRGIFVIVVVGSLGLVFGMIFNHLIRDIEHLEKKHHFFAGVFLPAISIIDLFVTVSVANRFAALINIDIQQEPFFITLVFVAAFMLPYVLVGLRPRR